MFGIFKEKCPVCKMGLEKGKTYPEWFDTAHHKGFGKQFCSESCKEEYGKQSEKEKSKQDGGCCH